MSSVLITGATGLLGRAIFNVFSSAGFDVIGTGFSRAKSPLISLDLTNPEALTATLDELKPSVIIHAAAERKPDVCENSQEETLAINLAATKHLANECTQRNIKLFFISTDYVFDGKDAPYIESAAPNPVNFYGKTKQLAEQAIQESSPAHAIIRVPVLYGEVEDLAESAVTIIAKNLKTNPNGSQDNWAVRYPTHVEDIALTLVDLVKQDKKETQGTFHVSGDQALTKYQMACIMADILNIDASVIKAEDTPTQTASRPYNCALADTRLKTLGINHQRAFRSAIEKIISAF